MLEILTDILQGRTEFGKKRSEIGAFAEHYIDKITCVSSVKWTGLGHIFKNPKMQILTPVFLLFL